jgi:hypothetical protein
MQEIELEKSKSNRSRCSSCGFIIGKDEPRLCESWTDNNHRHMKIYICWRCKDKVIKNLLDGLTRQKIKLTKLRKEMDSELQKEEVKKLILANEIQRKSNEGEEPKSK